MIRSSNPIFVSEASKMRIGDSFHDVQLTANSILFCFSIGCFHSGQLFLPFVPAFLLPSVPASAAFASAICVLCASSHFYHIRSLRERGHRLPSRFRLPALPSRFRLLHLSCRSCKYSCRLAGLFLLPPSPLFAARGLHNFSKMNQKTSIVFQRIRNEKKD
ncbi:hypothetical protein MmiAt1_02380 [Methanimicrococcus sp. At1]|uniref:Transmembrane protein n=1 Tax=Methanimicrococcus hacksteinii TaxID=3028293 RepID=A0ABU3VMT0_9EURY|nr:hypothetical protein [Methanimicrococcus sp. At1]